MFLIGRDYCSDRGFFSTKIGGGCDRNGLVVLSRPAGGSCDKGLEIERKTLQKTVDVKL